jgi:hypothetical protein
MILSKIKQIIKLIISIPLFILIRSIITLIGSIIWLFSKELFNDCNLKEVFTKKDIIRHWNDFNE